MTERRKSRYWVILDATDENGIEVHNFDTRREAEACVIENFDRLPQVVRGYELKVETSQVAKLK